MNSIVVYRKRLASGFWHRDQLSHCPAREQNNRGWTLSYVYYSRRSAYTSRVSLEFAGTHTVIKRPREIRFFSHSVVGKLNTESRNSLAIKLLLLLRWMVDKKVKSIFTLCWIRSYEPSQTILQLSRDLRYRSRHRAVAVTVAIPISKWIMQVLYPELLVGITSDGWSLQATIVFALFIACFYLVSIIRS